MQLIFMSEWTYAKFRQDVINELIILGSIEYPLSETVSEYLDTVYDVHIFHYYDKYLVLFGAPKHKLFFNIKYGNYLQYSF